MLLLQTLFGTQRRLRGSGRINVSLHNSDMLSSRDEGIVPGVIDRMPSMRIANSTALTWVTQ